MFGKTFLASSVDVFFCASTLLVGDKKGICPQKTCATFCPRCFLREGRKSRKEELADLHSPGKQLLRWR